MKKFLSFLVRRLSALSVVFMILSPSHAQTNDRAASLLRQSLEAQGGEQKLRAIKTVQWDAFGYRNEVEESERPEGPYVTESIPSAKSTIFPGTGIAPPPSWRFTR
jgi:hypothetical protein